MESGGGGIARFANRSTANTGPQPPQPAAGDAPTTDVESLNQTGGSSHLGTNHSFDNDIVDTVSLPPAQHEDEFGFFGDAPGEGEMHDSCFDDYFTNSATTNDYSSWNGVETENLESDKEMSNKVGSQNFIVMRIRQAKPSVLTNVSSQRYLKEQSNLAGGPLTSSFAPVPSTAPPPITPMTTSFSLNAVTTSLLNDATVRNSSSGIGVSLFQNRKLPATNESQPSPNCSISLRPPNFVTPWAKRDNAITSSSIGAKAVSTPGHAESSLSISGPTLEAGKCSTHASARDDSVLSTHTKQQILIDAMPPPPTRGGHASVTPNTSTGSNNLATAVPAVTPTINSVGTPTPGSLVVDRRDTPPKRPIPTTVAVNHSTDPTSSNALPPTAPTTTVTIATESPSIHPAVADNRHCSVELPAATHFRSIDPPSQNEFNPRTVRAAVATDSIAPAPSLGNDNGQDDGSSIVRATEKPDDYQQFTHSMSELQDINARFSDTMLSNTVSLHTGIATLLQKKSELLDFTDIFLSLEDICYLSNDSDDIRGESDS